MNSWLISTTINWAIARLVEPSTWAGCAASLAAALHTSLNTDFTNGFITAGVAISALLSIILKEGVSSK